MEGERFAPCWGTHSLKLGLKNIPYLLYVGCKKLLQLPKVVADYVPRFISDEVMYPARGDAYAIVISYARFGVSEDLLELLRTLKVSGVNPIVVCNGRAKEQEIAALKSEAHRLLLRRNIGRDFGAYRAASLFLHRSGLKASRVLYFNDSVIYLPGPGLTSMVGKLAASQAPVIGTFENYEIEHHVGSYAFALSGEVFHDCKVQRFWQRYRPYDVRPHAIHNGEIALSRRLKKLGYGMDVVYSVDQLATRMEGMDPAEILNLVRYMPTYWRGAFLDRARNHPFGAGTRIERELADRRTKPAARPTVPSLSTLKTQGVDMGDRLNSALQGLSKMALIDCILREIEDRSQVHVGFGVYHHLLGAPMVKKDLLQRGIFTEHDLRHVLGDVQDPLRAGVVRQLVSRGRPVAMRGTRRFLVNHGLE